MGYCEAHTLHHSSTPFKTLQQKSFFFFCLFISFLIFFKDLNQKLISDKQSGTFGDIPYTPCSCLTFWKMRIHLGVNSLLRLKINFDFGSSWWIKWWWKRLWSVLTHRMILLEMEVNTTTFGTKVAVLFLDMNDQNSKQWGRSILWTGFAWEICFFSSSSFSSSLFSSSSSAAIFLIEWMNE